MAKFKGDRKSFQKKAAEKPDPEPKYDPVELYALYDVSSQGFAIVADKDDGKDMLEKHVTQSGENPADKRLVHVKEVK
jgi:hypothetical protein